MVITDVLWSNKLENDNIFEIHNDIRYLTVLILLRLFHSARIASGKYIGLSCNLSSRIPNKRVAQCERVGPITQRSVDRNHALLSKFLKRIFLLKWEFVEKLQHQLCFLKIIK